MNRATIEKALEAIQGSNMRETEDLLRMALREGAAPIDMVLYCPACGKQHIDAEELEGKRTIRADELLNCKELQPHKTHQCHGCDHAWKPSDVHTNGVRALKSTGASNV